MIIYNPNNSKMIKERIKMSEEILNSINAKSVFITGSFLYKKDYKDIDVFVISRSKKEFKLNNKKVKITKINFNMLHSLFYHSISKSCISKNILPEKKLRVTISDYWDIINEAIPTIFNEKKNFKKDIRYLILYTEYFLKNEIMDTYSLSKKIDEFKNYTDVLAYINNNLPKTISRKINKNYAKRFFYTQAGGYKDLIGYKSHKFLYNLSHNIIKEGV